MAPREALECVDRTLRDLTNVDRPFGGKVIVLGMVTIIGMMTILEMLAIIGTIWRILTTSGR